MALIPRKRMSSDLLDPKPKKGSYNGVTSDGIFNATGEAIDNILDDGSASEAIVAAVPSSQSGDYVVGNYYEVQGKVARLRTKTEGDNVTQLTFDTTSGLLDALNSIVEDILSIGSSLQWKGPATVMELNTGITGIQPGWTYTLTDAGTLTDGSIAVEAGDEVAWTEDGDWFKVGGDSGKITVFETGFRFNSFPTFAQIRAEVANGKGVVIKTSDGEVWYLISSNSSYCYFEGASKWFQIRVASSNSWTTAEKYDDKFNSQSHNAVQNRILNELLSGEGTGEGFRELRYTYSDGLQFVKTHPSTKILSEGFPVDSVDYQLVRTFNGFIYKKITGWKVDGTVTVGLWNYDTKQYVAEVALSSTSGQSPDTIATLTAANASDEMELHVKGSGTIGAIMGAIR